MARPAVMTVMREREVVETCGGQEGLRLWGLPYPSPDILVLLEFRLVDRLLVRLFAGDDALLEQFLDRRVHEPHAVLGAALHRVLELVELALEIGRASCRERG